MNPLWILLIGMAVVIGGILLLRLHPFLSLIAAALTVAALTPSDVPIGERVAVGFGRTAQDIGLLIAMAAVLGKCLTLSGAAERIVLSCRRALGDEHVSIAFLVSSFVLAALVLSDTTFYLLIPLAQAMRLRTGKDYTLYVMSIVAGATMTHSLVPPAAGPAAVAAMLHVELHAMILAGVCIGAIASTSGYLYALWANRRWEIPLRPSLGVSKAQLDEIAARDETTLPPLWMSLLPIVVPVVLIAASAIAGKHASPLIANLGEKNVALTIAAAVGLIIVARRTRSIAAVGEGLSGAGVMILIICAGGAFGRMLRDTNIAQHIQERMPNSQLALLPLAWSLAAAVRTAQGSAIVAMITAAGIVAPMATAHGLTYHPAYLAVAIGCGSKPVSWMNDAGFWIIGRVSGLTEAETLKTSSVEMTIMGIVGLIAAILGAWLLPCA